MSLYSIATRIMDALTVNRAINEGISLPDVQQTVKEEFGVLTGSFPAGPSSTKFWVLNGGELIHVPYIHDWVGFTFDDYNDRKIPEEYVHGDVGGDILKSGGIKVVISENTEDINIGMQANRMTPKQRAAIIRIYKEYTPKRMYVEVFGNDRESFISQIDNLDWFEMLLGSRAKDREAMAVMESTSMSSISYLPTQLGAVKSLFSDLAKEKPDWDIEILEADDFNEFKIGDRAKISVPKKHWDSFLSSLGNQYNGKLLKLGEAKEPRKMTREEFMKERGVNADPGADHGGLEGMASVSGSARKAWSSRREKAFGDWFAVEQEYANLVAAGEIVDPSGKYKKVEKKPVEAPRWMQLQRMRYKELQELAKSLGVKHTMGKQPMIKAIEAAELAKGKMNESENEDDLRKLRTDLKTALLDITRRKEITKASVSAMRWISTFGMISYSTNVEKAVAIADEDRSKSVQRLYGKLLRVYGDDRGMLEMLINAVRTQKPLNTFEVFDKFDDLYGTVVKSQYGGVVLEHGAVVDFTGGMSQWIYVGNGQQEVLDLIEADYSQYVKVVKNMIWPIGDNGEFRHSFFVDLKHAIDDVSELG